MDKGAQEYLMALEKARIEAVKKGGEAAGKALIDDQKRKAYAFKESNTRAANIKEDNPVVRAARERLRRKNQNPNPGRAKPSSSSSSAPKKQQVGSSSNPRSRQQQYQKTDGGTMFGDFLTNLAAPFKGDGKSNPPKNKSTVYEARQRAANGGK